MRVHIALLVASLLVTPTLAQGEGGVPGANDVFWVLLKPTAEVSGTVITVADLGEVGALDPALKAKVERITIATAPPPSGSSVITKETLDAALKRDPVTRKARFALRGSSSVLVTPRTKRLSSDQIVTLVRSHLGARVDLLSESTKLILGANPSELVVPAGRYSTRFNVVEPRGGIPYAGTFSVRVVAVVDGKPSAERAVTMSLRRRGWILVATQDLNPKESMSRDMVKLEEREIFSAQGGILTDPGEIEGFFPRIKIRKGQPLMRRDFRGPPVVFRNSRVEVLMDVGNLLFRAPGVALEEGAIGEAIQVRTGQRRRIVRGTVLDSGTVRVRFEGRSTPRRRQP